MKEIYSDINIVGGGLIGVACAFSLSKLGYKISIIEKNSFFTAKKTNQDERTVAISEGTKEFLSNIGLWNEINKFAEPIKKIKIIDRNFSNVIDFDNSRRNSNLGYIVKNTRVLNIFKSYLKKRKNINILDNSNIIGLEYNNDKVITYGSDFKVYSDLNVAADGKNSFIKKLLKTNSYKKKYLKKALVLTFSHSANHNNTAYEFFYKNGPLAILPMQKTKNEYNSSIVWTNNNEYIDSLSNMEIPSLISTINESTRNIIGNVKKIHTLQIFPLSAHLNTKFYEKRTIYVGDSAHSVHPIAGQGWNLGMKDVETFLKISTKYKSLGIDLGNKFFCKEYHDNSFFRAYRLYQLTDKLDSLFQNENLLISLGRSLGIKTIQSNIKLKNTISDFAMGF